MLGGSRCDAADRDEEVTGWGDIVSELANDEGVALFISGCCCDAEHEGKVRYLTHTIRWPATRDVGGALARCSAPRRTVNVREVSGMCNGFGSCGDKALVYDRHE